MARYNRTTAQRGYGTKHEQLRARLLKAWRPGDPCARCGQPMLYRWTLDRNGNRIAAIHLGHTDDRTGYTGLEHARCNLRDGQRKTTAILRARGPLTPRQLTAIRMKQWQSAMTGAASRSKSSRW